MPEPLRHPLSKRFHDLLVELGELHDTKQRGYGLPTDPFHNVRASTEWGLPGWVGAMVRASDKVRRLQAVARGTTLTDEKVHDLFVDLAVYALIALILYEEPAAGHGKIEQEYQWKEYSMPRQPVTEPRDPGWLQTGEYWSPVVDEVSAPPACDTSHLR